MIEKIKEKIEENFKLTAKEKEIIDLTLVPQLNLPRLYMVVQTMVEYHIDGSLLASYILFQYSKTHQNEADKIATELSKNGQKLYQIFTVLKDVSSFSYSGQAEEIRQMFVAICQDMRVIIIKFATILYDLKLIQNPMTAEQKTFVHMVEDIFTPLAERLGLYKFKNEFEDKAFELLQPEEFEKLKNDAYTKTEDNQKQFEITRRKLQKILDQLGIKGEIYARQKHFASIYKKLVRQNITLGSVYDLLAMRVIVPTIQDCYAVFGQVHAIYRPIAGRVKDFIANPKPNGYQSLHTTIIADNNRPLEIQIRTFDMHRANEYGVAAHWIYKEKNARARNKFDEKMAWFRQILESSGDMSSDEFLETLKTDLYGESIFVQTPKGKVLEFPLGSTIIDFAYAVHSDIGNTCVGGKINDKLVPIYKELSNGDVVEILTNNQSKGPSRDWLGHIKTNSARSKIRAFFKSELKDENIKTGKSIIEQNFKAKNLNITKDVKEKYLLQIAKSLMIEDLNNLYAEVGAGSLAIASVMGRFLNLYNKENPPHINNDVIRLKQNKDGVLVDGDSGMLVRYAGCCNPVAGEEILGYVSRGKGVTVHRKDCSNIKYLEPERLIKAEWQQHAVTDFLACLKVVAENKTEVINNLNTAAREMKNKLKGFGYKQVDGMLEFEILFLIKNKTELDNVIKALSSIKNVKSVARSS